MPPFGATIRRAHNLLYIYVCVCVCVCVSHRIKDTELLLDPGWVIPSQSKALRDQSLWEFLPIYSGAKIPKDPFRTSSRYRIEHELNTDILGDAITLSVPKHFVLWDLNIS